MSNQKFIQAIKEDKVLPLFYHDEPEITIAVAKALYNAGIRCLEFTNRGRNALENFKLLVEEREVHMPGMHLAVGTIRYIHEAESFLKAGADFLISPIFDHELAVFAHANSVLWIPGCMSPGEIHMAQKSGAGIVKIFPGNVLGTGFLEAIRPLFSGIDYIVTGGVEANRENIDGWLQAGASGVGLGTKLITKEILTNKRFDELQLNTQRLLASLR